MRADGQWMEFGELAAMSGVAHRFVLRQPGVDTDGEREEVILKLRGAHEAQVTGLGFAVSGLVLAEQVHGCGVAVVSGETPAGAVMEGVDGLVCNVPGRVMGIYVADCCAVFFADPVRKAIGLAHSGKRGTELGVVPATIAAMQSAFGTRPEDLIIQLSPCIRPPDYETDFASEILRQCQQMGVHNARDCGKNTAADLQRYYSYRVERGKTGRMLALLAVV